MLTTREISPAPWDRSGWTGELVSVDGTDTTDFVEDDVEEVIAFATTPDGWDGETVGIVRLKDGRIAGWAADWGPTGNGFCKDAYGGTADIFFGKTVEAVKTHLGESALCILRDYLVT